MLHHSNTTLHASGLHGLEPLLGIGWQGGSERALILTSQSPLTVGIGIHAVVEEGIKLRLLPAHLSARGHRKDVSRLIVGVSQLLRRHVEGRQLGMDGHGEK